MTHALVFVLSLAGFVALALATERQQEALFGRALAPRRTRQLRCVGWAALLLALAVAVQAEGWSLGLVTLSGHTSLGAAIVAVVLILRQRGAGR